ncbi:MAG: hypothetical protein Q6358_09445 [Candidatus Brocadiales bacterium]|nr:hypothetical protein [Candidatus Brocadiales bacterium]
MFLLRESFREEFNYQLNQLRRITSHGPSIGRFVEHLLIRLLKKYLPKSIDFTSGFVQGIGIERGSSSQIDIICYDRDNYPILFDIEEFKVVPAKAVKGLIEIKATLSKSQLKQTLNNSCSDELIEVPSTSKMYLFSTSSSTKPKAAFDTIKAFYEGKPKITKFFSAFYSLDWDEIIISPLRTNDNILELEIIRLKLPEKDDIAIFVGLLIRDLYQQDTLESIANHLGPSLFRPLETHKFTL